MQGAQSEVKMQVAQSEVKMQGAQSEEKMQETQIIPAQTGAAHTGTGPPALQEARHR